ASEVKNHEKLEHEIPAPVADHVRLYLRDYRHLLITGPNPYLFPGEKGAHKGIATMRQQMARFASNRLGIQFHPHLIRKITAKLFLDVRPGEDRVVQKQLGQRSDRSTAIYTGGADKAARQHF